MHSDDYLKDFCVENIMPKNSKVLIIACGALALSVIHI